jgi:hypothetical protein
MDTGEHMMQKSLVMIGGLGLGAGLLYWLAPKKARQWSAMLLKHSMNGARSGSKRRRPTAKRAIRSASRRRAHKA